VSREAASPEDVTSQMFWRALRAKVLATRGATSEAERLARDAVELGRKADCIDMQGDVLMDLSEVLRLAGRPHAARGAAEEALSRYRRKGNVVSAGRARAVLADL
jgi:ATP/maltotriose-dependent transcriptional regulator MalT